MNARFTSKADIDATQTDVCFVPIADIAFTILGPHQRVEERSLELSGRLLLRS